MRLSHLAASVFAAWMVVLFIPAAGLAQPAGDAAPFTVLYDTGAASPTALDGAAMAARKGWSVVPEDTLTHPFTGNAAIMNDRVAVVVRHGSGGVEMYSRSHGVWTQRAQLLPLAGDGAGTVSSVKIIENSQAAVMIDLAVASPKGSGAFRFRLSAGEALLDVRGGQGAGRLRIVDQAQYLIVPDFFADDMVYDPLAVEQSRVGLPAENSLLGLADDGKAIVACVWPSSRQNADLFVSGQGADRKIAGYEIDLPDAGRLWISVMEGPGIWHGRHVMDPKSGAELALEWQPGMPARWRADLVTHGPAALSTCFADTETGASTENLRSDGSCRFESGRAVVRLTDVGTTTPRLILVYPIERTRTTPLTDFCLVDIMRNALGVGPCQYVLDTEKLSAADNPTPAQVTRWVEKQFEKKPTKRDPDAIRDQLTKMIQQVKRTDARIGDYVSFGMKVKQACAEEAKSPQNAKAAGRLLAIAQEMTAPAATSATVEPLAAEVAAQAEQPDALTKSAAAIAAIRAVGAAEDYALAKFRMAARRLKQECRTLEAENPAVAPFAGEIQKQSEEMLVKK